MAVWSSNMLALVVAAWAVLGFVLTTAGPVQPAFHLKPARGAVQPAVNIRSHQGVTPYAVVQAVRREISVISNSSTEFDVKVNQTINRSWDGAVLLQIGNTNSFSPTGNSSLAVTEGLKIVCTTCYITGVASGQLSIGHFNASKIIHQTINQVENNFENLATQVGNYLETAVKDIADDVEILMHGDVLEKIYEHGFQSEAHLFKFPTFNYSFNMDVPALPEAKLRFGFDDLELYVQLDTILSLGATYTLNLYTSDTPLGIGISDKLDLGVIFTIDLILDLDGKIDISSGFHIKVDNGLGIDIDLFGDGANGITFTGGQFEFLPVTIESAGVTFKAILRVGAHAGFDLNGPSIGGPQIEVMDHNLDPSMGVGIGVDLSVFADVAEFVTDVRYEADDKDCELAVTQAYTFGLGAAAGATLSLGTQVWGPTPSTMVPIFYTTMASVCALSSTPTASSMPSNYSSSGSAHKRQLSTTLIFPTQATHTAVVCQSSGLINCPASLQSTAEHTVHTIVTTVVRSGMSASDITLSSYQNVVSTTMPFGANAARMPVSSGSPKPYTPPPPPSPKPTSTNSPLAPLEHATEHPDRNVVIGLSAGLAIAVLFGVGAIVSMLLQSRRNRKYAAVPRSEAAVMVADPYEPYRTDGMTMSLSKPDKTVVTVAESRRFSGS